MTRTVLSRMFNPTIPVHNLIIPIPILRFQGHGITLLYLYLYLDFKVMVFFSTFINSEMVQDEATFIMAD